MRCTLLMVTPDVIDRATPSGNVLDKDRTKRKDEEKKKNKEREKPRRLGLLGNSKKIGDAWENIIKFWLRDHGFVVVKSLLSRGPFDLFAIPPDYDWRTREHKNENWDWLYEKTLAVQAKYNGYVKPAERKHLKYLQTKHSRTKVVIMYSKENGHVGIKLFI